VKQDSWHRTTCRLCDQNRLELVVPITPSAVADAYLPKERLSEAQKSFSLDLYFCNDCGHVQLLDVVDPEILFRNYAYESSGSPGLVRHLSEYADMALESVRPTPGSLVIDIGSNDGTLLKFLNEKGFRVLGVDPGREIARKATEAGIETIPSFLTKELASEIRESYGPAAIVTANNVFAHGDDMAGMTDSIRELLGPDGVFIFEASYLVDVVEKLLLNTIFHEHLCYHTVQPMQAFLSRHGLDLIDVKRVPVQGGSIIGFAQRAGGLRKEQPTVAQLVALEKERGFDRADVYKEFALRIEILRGQTEKLLSDIKRGGKQIAGFGVSRGGTTLIHHFGLGEVLEYIVDDNPETHNLHSPGHKIPVMSPQVIYERKPDYVIILAYSNAEPIIRNHQAYLEQGGRFIVPLPEFEVVSHDNVEAC